jgi:hypothetical protein
VAVTGRLNTILTDLVRKGKKGGAMLDSVKSIRSQSFEHKKMVVDQLATCEATWGRCGGLLVLRAHKESFGLFLLLYIIRTRSHYAT